jgi:L-ascorbate metabolism protein UlaG (beta-lactamase superfamily)
MTAIGKARTGRAGFAILVLGIAVAAFLTAAGANGQDREKTKASLEIVTTEASQPEATIWYLGHCGYAVQTAKHFLIFDYIELEENPTERGLDVGFADPAEIAKLNLPVTVFVTHSHVDHFDEIILSWQDTIETIQYVFGWPQKESPNRHVMTGRRAELVLDGIKIHTVDSHHSGVIEAGYLVQVDGLCLFHAGDYQGRPGRGRASRAVEDMQHLMTKTDRVDLLFIGAWLGGPYPDIIEGLAPRVIFPMHHRKQEEKYQTFADDVSELGLTPPVICPTKRGDRFVYREGVVE